MSKFSRRFGCLAALAVAVLGIAGPAAARSRIKDIVSFEGVRENQLIGYGLVVGLNGTGDSLRNAPFTKQSLQSMLERLGVNTRDAANMDTKNVAAVTVTANLPAFAAAGSQIDVSVAAMGDAKSLLGGTLLVTSLIGADGKVYAVAQGTVQTGAVSAQGASGSSVTRGVPTAGRIAAGATVELEVEPDTPAKVVIDEVAGVVVMGEDVKISTVAIAQGNLTISVNESPQVSQPAPESLGQTAIVPRSSVKVDEDKGKRLIVLKSGASLATLVKGLNALGVSPRDMISILQTIKAAGALQADIEVM